MAKTSQVKLLSSPQTVAQIIRLLDASRATTGMHTYEHFHRSLLVWEAVLRQVKMQPWLEACRGLERGLQPLCEALALLMLEASVNYEDVVGAMYMEIGQNDKRFGQFFTPSPVAWCMAEIALVDLKLPAPGEPPLKIYEPACGSGVMFLAAAGVIESRYPGAIGRGLVEFYGSDLDPVCVAMCRLNLLLHGIGRKAQTIDQFLGQPLPTGSTAQPSDSHSEQAPELSPPDSMPGGVPTTIVAAPSVAPKIMGPLLWALAEETEPLPPGKHLARLRTGPARPKPLLPAQPSAAGESGQRGGLSDEAPW